MALYLVASLGFVAIGIWLPSKPGDELLNLLASAFFGLCALVFAWMLVRPNRLLLDNEGFTQLGGFVRNPKKVLWAEIEEFFVYRLPRGGKMIGFNYRPGARPTSRLTKLNRWAGADGALQRGWPGSPESMVQKLNDLRLQATRGGV
jgi:hypothetical protein